MAFTINDLKMILAGMVSANDDTTTNPSSSSVELGHLFRRSILSDKSAADGAASTATSAQGFWIAPSACVVRAAYVIPRGALTANDTNYATVTLKAGATTIATLLTTTTGSGNWAANVTEPCVLATAAADLRVAAGTVLTWEIAKAGTGVVVPISTFQIDVELGEPLP